MDAPKVTFDDGAAYERMMGPWSRIAGEQFIDWLKPSPKLRWIDVGCGNGAFTELLIERCSASGVEGVDPSDAQISFARSRRPGSSIANYQRGDALSLPFPDNTFDAAAMAWSSSFFTIQPKALRKWFARSSPVAWLRRMHGMLQGEDCQILPSTMYSAEWGALWQRSRALMLPSWT